MRTRLQEAGDNLKTKAQNKLTQILSGEGKKRKRSTASGSSNKKKRKLAGLPIIKFGPPLLSPQLKKGHHRSKTQDIFAP